MQKYNEIAIDHFYRAQRLEYLIYEMSTLKDSEINNIGDLNNAIRTFKNEMKELRYILVKFKIIEAESDRIIKSTKRDDVQIELDNKMANLQIERAHKVKTPANIQKVNMQTNAYANKNLVGIKNKNNQILKLLAENNKQMARDKMAKVIEHKKRNCYFYQTDCESYKSKKGNR